MKADSRNAENPVAQLLRDALQLQRKAYLAHPVPSLAERHADLKQLARFVQDNRQSILAAISADFGHRSTHETLMLEFTPFLAGIRQCLQHVKRWMRPQRRHIERLTYGLATNEVIPQPLGVVGVIVPWNFPLLLSMVPLANIFAAGNRAIVKMSESSRHLAALLIEQAPKYFPPEKLQFFDETGGVGLEFSKLPFDHLIFTGSGQTGRAVMAAAGQNLCPVTLELGGKAPEVVCDDFELDVAAERGCGVVARSCVIGCQFASRRHRAGRAQLCTVCREGCGTLKSASAKANLFCSLRVAVLMGHNASDKPSGQTRYPQTLRSKQFS